MTDGWKGVLSSTKSTTLTTTPAFKKIANKDQLIRDFTDDDIKDLEDHRRYLEESYFDKQNINDKYELTKISEIINPTLSQIYSQKCKELKEIRRKEPLKRNVFYVTTDENEVKDIALNGFKCRESAAEIDNLLGPSRHGLHFCKHIDLLLNYQYSRRVKEFYVILAEMMMIGSFSFMAKIPVPIRAANSYEFDLSSTGNVHMPIVLPSEFPNNMPDQRYKHSMLYTYEHEDYDGGNGAGNLLEKPRTVMPMAIFKYENKNPFQFDKTLFSFQE